MSGIATAQAPATPNIDAAPSKDEAQPNESPRPVVILVTGTPGEAEYGKMFTEWSARWAGAAAKASAELVRIGESPQSESAPTDKALLKQAIESHAGGANASATAELWLVLIGHGTFDGTRALFNLRGEDASAEELADWLKPLNRPVAVVNCSASSAPFIPKLSAPDRVVVTATQSGFEQNFARFGDALSANIADPAADLDKDGQTSLLEAFLAASRATAEFYELDARLATEHALIDDNGDGKGTGADWFRGIRVVKQVAGGASGGTPDGLRAHQFHLVRSERERNMAPEVRAKRDALELDIAALQSRKESMDEGAYYAQVEALLIELARLYESIDAGEADADAGP